MEESNKQLELFDQPDKIEFTEEFEKFLKDTLKLDLNNKEIHDKLVFKKNFIYWLIQEKKINLKEPTEVLDYLTFYEGDSPFYRFISIGIYPKDIKITYTND